MSSWLLRFSSETSAYEVEVELHDTPGPLNRWTSRTREAFSTENGVFTNQTNNAVDVAGNWKLFSIDIDDTELGRDGSGECASAGTFPNGPLKWLVIRGL